MGLSKSNDAPQLRMIWPERLLDSPPDVTVPPGYTIRTSHPGDERGFFKLMASVGWPGWDAGKLRPWLPRILPDGWFVITRVGSDEIIASAMALKDMGEFGEQGGELGWVACAPEHRGRGLGKAVCAAATVRMLAEGYRHIHLYTEHWRLAAIGMYLKLGYVPLPEPPETVELWRRVYTRLGLSFKPDSAGAAIGYRSHNGRPNTTPSSSNSTSNSDDSAASTSR